MVARKNLMKAAGFDVVDYSFAFGIGAAGARNTALDRGMKAGVVSVTKEATAGQYSIVLKGPTPRIVAVNATLEASAVADVTIQVLSIDPSTGTVVLQCKTAASAANPASGAVINVRLAVREKSTPD